MALLETGAMRNNMHDDMRSNRRGGKWLEHAICFSKPQRLRHLAVKLLRPASGATPCRTLQALPISTHCTMIKRFCKNCPHPPS